MAQITVGELIEKLSRIADKSLKVQVEGCDCWGPCTGVAIQNNHVLIARGGGVEENDYDKVI